MANSALAHTPLYPHIRVHLTDGNAFSILGLVTLAMRADGLGDDAIKAFLAEAIGGSYEDLLSAAARWVSVEAHEEEECDR
jgi:hypothetical protein